MGPADIIQTVNICLVHFLFRGTRNTFQLIVFILIHKDLSAGYPNDTSVGARLIPLLIVDRILHNLDIHDRRQFIQQDIPLIPQFVGYRPVDLYQIDLLVHRSQILRNGIDMIDTDLDLVIDVSLQVLQIAIHIVKVIRHTLSRGDKSSLRGITAGILGDLL